MATREIDSAEAAELGFDTEDPTADALWHVDVGTMAGDYVPDMVLAETGPGPWIWHYAEQTVLCDTEAEAKALFGTELADLVRTCAESVDRGGSDFLWESGQFLIATVGHAEYGDDTLLVWRTDGDISWRDCATSEEAVGGALQLAEGTVEDEAVPAAARAALAEHMLEVRIRLALSSKEGVEEFCRSFKVEDADAWYPEEFGGIALAEAGGRWVLAVENSDPVNPSYALFDDEAAARTAFAHNVASYYQFAQDRAYDWTSLDRTQVVRAAPIESSSDTYAVVAAFGDREHELTTVEGRDAARLRAAGILATHFHRLPPVEKAADTEALIAYQALRRRVMLDEAASSEAVLGAAIRRADKQKLYGHGRGRPTWTELANHLGVHRDTVTEIRKGRAW
ncbi:hypothetical protein [Kitasatospora sp. NPDC088783]|uniref:hypothetical protein n=1 Tax=Kitasatospora sp. NPDC088783 TaxID=3364077 RepID=UPI003823C8D5